MLHDLYTPSNYKQKMHSASLHTGKFLDDESSSLVSLFVIVVVIVAVFSTLEKNAQI